MISLFGLLKIDGPGQSLRQAFRQAYMWRAPLQWELIPVSSMDRADCSLRTIPPAYFCLIECYMECCYLKSDLTRFMNYRGYFVTISQ